MLDLQGSKPRWAAALILLVLTGCGDASSEGDKAGPASPPGEILTVPINKENEGTQTPAGKPRPVPVLSRTEYISKADRLCRQYLSQIQGLEKGAQVAAREADYGAAADRFEQAIAESEREIAALRHLAVPEGSEAKLSRIYSGVEDSNRLFRGSLDKLRSGDVEGFNRIGNQARLASVPSKRSAIAFGFEVCGRSD
jgi:hypothetical protein